MLANASAGRLTEAIGPELLEPPANALRITLHPEGMASSIVNLAEWSGHLLRRLRRQISITADEELERLYDELAGYPGVDADTAVEVPAADEILLPLQLRVGETELALVSTVSVFGTALDVTLAELAIEAFYPADDATARALLTR